jgi:hypothetical protein
MRGRTGIRNVYNILVGKLQDNGPLEAQVLHSVVKIKLDYAHLFNTLYRILKTTVPVKLFLRTQVPMYANMDYSFVSDPLFRINIFMRYNIPRWLSSGF